MHLSHHRALGTAAHLRATRPGRQRGYVLVTFAMLLVPLLLMVGLSVDVGSWYNRASNIQKAADAAALAGVVWLPDLPKAEAAARATATKNGFTDGGDISVTVTKVSNRQLRVTIEDRAVPAMFAGNLGMADIPLKRRASAEYVLPVPLGSPRNFIGTGNLPSGYNENLWLSVNTWCTDTEDGDRYQSPFDNTRSSLGGSYRYITSRCQSTYSGSGRNLEYRPQGYEYYVDVPEDRTGNIEVLLYDARYNEQNGSPDLELRSGDQDYHYALYEADSTPLDDSDNVAVAGCTKTYTKYTSFDSINFLGESRWNRLCTITTAMPTGRYILRVTNNPGERYAAGANNFSIVAKYTSAAWNASSALCDARTVARCPRVYGKDALSVFASESSSTADFYLAQIDAEHNGKTLQVELFDPGEGGYQIRMRRPTGTNSWTDATFSWTASDGSSGGPTTALDVTGSRFNGDTVNVEIKLDNYNPPVDNAWWQVRYRFLSGSVTDRTTWSANVIGDPVHLIEE